MKPAVIRPEFRADIEGIRALAVLLVVLYHAGIPAFGGGYIGVDVFFVVSGFLITTLLVKQVERTGYLPYLDFYARRTRRLLPALTVVLFCTAIGAYVIYSPLEQLDLALTVLATALYVSNILFAGKTTDYLAADADENPLLHTWSLAVEEQFYFVWPLLIALAFALALRRNQRQHWRHGLIHMMAAVFLVSLMGSVLLTSHTQPWAFFSSPTRAWEFAAGGLAALLPGFSDSRHARAMHISPGLISWLGLGCILAAGLFFDNETPFPGYTALLPVLGTVLLLDAGTHSRSPITAILSSAPMQWLGRLSYSWYLWHWPMLVFAAALLPSMQWPSIVATLLVSLLLAQLSYRYIENPIRHHRALRRKSWHSLGLAAGLTAAGVALAVLLYHVARQVSHSPQFVQITGARHDLPDYYADPGCKAGFANRRALYCEYGDTDSDTTIVLWGDSHAAQWATALDAAAKARGWRLLPMTKSACPSIQVSFWHPQLGRRYTECGQWQQDVLAHIRRIQPAAVILTNSLFYPLRPEYDISRDTWLDATHKTLTALQGHTRKIVHLRDNPRPSFDVPKCLGRAVWRPRWLPKPACDFRLASHQDNETYARELRLFADFANVESIDLTRHICAEARCPVKLGEMIMYRDNNHLTASFAATLAPALGEALSQIIGENAQRERRQHH